MLFNFSWLGNSRGLISSQAKVAAAVGGSVGALRPSRNISQGSGGPSHPNSQQVLASHPLP